jgi:NAD kinase
MLKVAVVGREKGDIELFKGVAKKVSSDFVFVSKGPEVVISFGGDGSFLYSERIYPGVPKLILRHKSICKMCHHGPLDVLLKKILLGDYKIREEEKLEVVVEKEGAEVKKIATNDIVVSNHLPYRALRFSVKLQDFDRREIIGDGVVVSTAFGSTGYFHSVTRKKFSKGFGVAFNNSVDVIDPLFCDEPLVEIEIERNDAYVSADNDPDLILVGEGDKVIIRKSKEFFRLIDVDVPREREL